MRLERISSINEVFFFLFQMLLRFFPLFMYFAHVFGCLPSFFLMFVLVYYQFLFDHIFVDTIAKVLFQSSAKLI